MNETPPHQPAPRTDDDGNIRIAIVGSRSFPERETVENYVRNSLPPNAHVISGGAEGPDTWAVNAARERGLRVTIHKPDYFGLPTDERRRKFEIVSRLYARNKRVVLDAFYVVAFYNPESKTRGTANAVKHARENERPVLVILPRGVDPNQKRNRI